MIFCAGAACSVTGAAFLAGTLGLAGATGIGVTPGITSFPTIDTGGSSVTIGLAGAACVG